MRVNTRILSRDRKLFVAVSGGMDSVAAAHWLRNNFRRDFKIVHINHGTNPEYNGACEYKVSLLAQFLDVSLEIYKGTSLPNATEDNLRTLRLRGFVRVCPSDSLIVTAHHLDDAVESYLMNVLRGRGEEMPISDKTEFGQFTIAHPFAYSVTRDDFAQHIEENNLHCFVEEDPSNESEKPLRNFVRHVLVAELNNRKDVCLRSIVRDKWGWSGK